MFAANERTNDNDKKKRNKTDVCVCARSFIFPRLSRSVAVSHARAHRSGGGGVSTDAFAGAPPPRRVDRRATMESPKTPSPAGRVRRVQPLGGVGPREYTHRVNRFATGEGTRF